MPARKTYPGIVFSEAMYVKEIEAPPGNACGCELMPPLGSKQGEIRYDYYAII